MAKMTDEYRRDTRLVRAGLERSQFQETSEAMFLNSGYVYDSAEEAAAAFAGEADRFVYSRYGNPTVSMLQTRLAALEGAEACLATGTGMAGVFAALACQLDKGDRVVASRALFGACYAILNDILPRWGVTTEFVDGTDLDQDDWASWEEYKRRNFLNDTDFAGQLPLPSLRRRSARLHVCGRADSARHCR